MTERRLQLSGHQCGKKSAWIYENERYIILVSYRTIVAYISKRTGKVYVRGWYSVTTSTHINGVLREYGYKPIYRGEIGKRYTRGAWENIHKGMGGVFL